ncbi:MAG TPA: hypothetical protein VGL53_10355 [Bryobacteraceae bacterium]|jgi:uncharacterized protein (TIGR03437 family)
MKRDLPSVIFFTLLTLVPFGGNLKGQTNPTISSVQVHSNPTGAQFLVDGYPYIGAQTFLWPAGSKHTLEFPLSFQADGTNAPYQQTLDGSTRYSSPTWVLSNGVSPTSGTSVTVVADPTISSIILNVSVSYKVNLHFSSFPVLAPGNCTVGTTPQDALRPGVVVVAGTCYGSDADVWMAKGALAVLAYPFPGWAFVGWSTNGGPPISYSGSVTINGPTGLQAQFVLAKRVTFRTNPAGFTLLIDRTTTPTLPAYALPYTPASMCPFNLQLPPNPPVTIPALCYGDFDFIPGSSHTIGGASPQYDTSGTMFILDSFSNGLQPNSVYVAGTDTQNADLITGNFTPGISASFLTNPGGLQISIDGRSNWITYNFAWGTGTSHTISAADQTDKNGRLWKFQNWSNGGTATQTFTMDGPIRWTANYAVTPQVILQSNPPGVSLQVDGAACVTPCTLNRPAGSISTVVAPTTLPISDTARSAFAGWSDGGAANRTISFTADQQILVLNYQTQFMLQAAGNPAQGSSFSYNPPSPDGFFNQNTPVTVTAQVKGGYQFVRWDGDLSGTYNQGTVMMAAPKAVVALLNKVPFVAPAGIGNAAGPTPDGTVAPGSLIAISGESLAPAFEAGRTNPLAQAIGDSTVTVNNNMLPLIFIAPEEIRAQMFSTLTDGDYSLTVHTTGQPDVTGQFTVARNSPGLFPARVQDPAATIPAAWALHADGTEINAGSPAIQGEQVTLYGTGFGPVSGMTFDAFPASADMPMIDPVQVQAADLNFAPDWAGIPTGKTGLMAVKFTITSDFPTATSVNVSIVVNGHTSNQVTLPLQ